MFENFFGDLRSCAPECRCLIDSLFGDTSGEEIDIICSHCIADVPTNILLPVYCPSRFLVEGIARYFPTAHHRFNDIDISLVKR